MRHYKDGWHVIKGYNVYVERDCIWHGLRHEYAGFLTGYPYRYDRDLDGYVNAVGVKVETFRKSDKYVLL